MQRNAFKEVVKMFTDAVEQEKAWADYPLQRWSQRLAQMQNYCMIYIEWICCKRMTALGLKCPYTVPQANLFTLTQKWT